MLDGKDRVFNLLTLRLLTRRLGGFLDLNGSHHRSRLFHLNLGLISLGLVRLGHFSLVVRRINLNSLGCFFRSFRSLLGGPCRGFSFRFCNLFCSLGGVFSGPRDSFSLSFCSLFRSLGGGFGFSLCGLFRDPGSFSDGRVMRQLFWSLEPQGVQAPGPRHR